MKKNGIKKRIYDKIQVNGTLLLSIFDPGAQRSYITEAAVKKAGLFINQLKKPFAVGLGGKTRLLKKYIDVEGTLQRLPLHLHLYMVDDIGKTDDDTEIDILFGILAMEEWHIELDIKNKKVDLSHYKREFIEY